MTSAERNARPASEYERYVDPDGLILRDWLALDRTRLANERTALAYVRTFIGMEGAALALIKLFDVPGMRPIAAMLIACGFLVLAAGAVRCLRVRARLAAVGRGGAPGDRVEPSREYEGGLQ